MKLVKNLLGSLFSYKNLGDIYKTKQKSNSGDNIIGHKEENHYYSDESEYKIPSIDILGVGGSTGSVGKFIHINISNDSKKVLYDVIVRIKLPSKIQEDIVKFKKEVQINRIEPNTKRKIEIKYDGTYLEGNEINGLIAEVMYGYKLVSSIELIQQKRADGKYNYTGGKIIRYYNT